MVAIVEDDESVRKALSRLLRTEGYDPAPFCSAEELFEWERNLEPALFLLDVGLPEISGVDMLARLRSDGVTTPAIFLTALDSAALRQRALELGAVAYLVKPVDRDVFLQAIEDAIEG